MTNSHQLAPRRSTIALAALAAVSTIALVACGGADDPVPTATTPETPAIAAGYKYQIAMVDAQTNQPITDALTVTFTGAAVDSSEVVDQNNVSVKGKSYTVTDGLFAAAGAFDGTNDVFTVLAGNRNLGWNETGMQLSRDTSVLGMQTITLKLTNTAPAKVAALNSDTSLGLAMKVDTLAAVGGALVSSTASAPVAVSTTAKTVLNTDGANESVGTATVAFPAGVKATDSTGAPVTVTGNISVSVTKFSNNEVSSLSAFPGGFVPSVDAPAAALSGGATADNGAFVSGGFAQFNVTDSTGKALKTFDKDLDLKIDLPKTTMNQDGSALIKAGDTYPIWSFDEATGKWKFETNGTVQEKTPVDASNFEVTFKSKHLSYWNLDYYGATCTAGLNLTGRPTGDTRPLYLTMTGVTGSSFIRTKGPITDSALTFARYPNNMKVNVMVKDAKGAVVGSVKNVNLCQAGPVNSVALTLPTINLTSLTVNVTESCADGVSVKRARPAWVYYNASGTWFSGYAQKASSTSTTASLTLPGIESGSTGTLYVYNPFTNRYDTTTNFGVNAPGTTKDVNYPKLTCSTGGVLIK